MSQAVARANISGRLHVVSAPRKRRDAALHCAQGSIAQVSFHGGRQQAFMRKFLIVAVVWSLAACATGPQIQAKENMLSAAGFVIQPANTPARIASLRQLPAHTFVWKSQGDKLLTLYSDPTICGCLYVGDQKAYQAYRREVLRKQLADEARMTAMENTNNMMMDDWGWGPWGNFGNDPFSYY